jgi:hypothetical protein
MNADQFRAHIATVGSQTLDKYFDEITEKLAKARSTERAAGYAQALDDLIIEANLRLFTPDADTLCLTDGELLAALGVSPQRGALA